MICFPTKLISKFLNLQFFRKFQMCSPNLIQEFYGVSGYNNRQNDVIYCPPTNNVSKKVIVFFGGDVQDFEENMKGNKENKKFLKWNLNNIALLLLSFFKNSHIIIVRPSRIELNTFSCYDNFVKTPGKFGNPEHTSTYGALEHLQSLIQSILSMNKIKTECISPENDEGTNVTILRNDLSIKLIGFSKGCVVLNQLLYEFDNWKQKDGETKIQIINQITDIYWLDGGHNGGKNVWITSEKLLQTLITLGITVHVHVSPYQVCDTRRKHIGIEEALFTKYLTDNGGKIYRVFHFDNELPSIDNHFKVIAETFTSK